MFIINTITNTITSKNIPSKSLITRKTTFSQTKNDTLELSTTERKTKHNKISFKGNFETYKAKIALESQKEYNEVMSTLQQAKKEDFKDNINEAGDVIRKFTDLEGIFNKIKVMREISPKGLLRMTEFNPKTLEIYEIIKYNRKKSGKNKTTPVSYTFKDGTITSFCKDSKRQNDEKWKSAEVILFNENNLISSDKACETEQLEKKIVNDGKKIQEEGFQMNLRARTEYSKAAKAIEKSKKENQNNWGVTDELEETADEENTQKLMLELNGNKIARSTTFNPYTSKISEINIGCEITRNGIIYAKEVYSFADNKIMQIDKDCETSSDVKKIKERFMYVNGELIQYLKNCRITASGNWQAQEVYCFKNGQLSKLYKNFISYNDHQKSAIMYTLKGDKITDSINNWKNY